MYTQHRIMSTAGGKSLENDGRCFHCKPKSPAKKLQHMRVCVCIIVYIFYLFLGVGLSGASLDWRRPVDKLSKTFLFVFLAVLSARLPFSWHWACRLSARFVVRLIFFAFVSRDWTFCRTLFGRLPTERAFPHEEPGGHHDDEHRYDQGSPLRR